MRCPKCGKVLQKTNDGSYVCDFDCKYVFNTWENAEKLNELNDMIDAFVYKYGSMFRDIVKKSMRNDLKKIVDEAKKEASNSEVQN